MKRLGVILLAGWLASCGGDDGPQLTSLLRVDYASTFVPVRPCRPSSDHNLNNVLIFADETAAPTYMARTGEFPVGCVIVKEEHDLDDTSCTGPVVTRTVMSKLATGSSKLTYDWRWQRIGKENSVVSQDEKRCINCHADCGGPPFGYGGTCSAP